MNREVAFRYLAQSEKTCMLSKHVYDIGHRIENLVDAIVNGDTPEINKSRFDELLDIASALRVYSQEFK